MSKKYNRYFLIFNEEDKGFEAASDKQPTGYTKIETKSGKCKITVYAQNLKSDNGPYICYLVDSTKNPAKVARLGEFLVDEAGKGETVWEHDAKNILGTGLSSDKFNVAAIVKEGNRLQVPLAGYSGKDKVQWRNNIDSNSFRDESEEVEKGLKCQGDIKEQISEIVEQAESEVLYENKDIVEATRFGAEDEFEEERLPQSGEIYEEVLEYPIINGSEIIEESNGYDPQLQRNDDDYIDFYSEEGMAFKHYEQEINLQDADINYASRMTAEVEAEKHSEIDIAETNKMQVFQSESTYEDNREEDGEEYLYDARDIEIQSIEYSPSILTKAMESVNLDRGKLCDDVKADIDKLDLEIEKEFKKFLQRELDKYKKLVLKHVCEKESHHGGCNNKSSKHVKNKNNKPEKVEGIHAEIEHYAYPQHNEHKESKCEAKENKKKGYAKILHGILNNHEKVVVKGAKDCNFWKVKESDKFPNKDNANYPYYSAIHHLKMTYPYINYLKYFKIKGYYHFGIKYDKDSEVKYLIYGIEGDKKENHQPYKGMTGFVSWVPHGKTGIWLMYYNPYTGCIMIPKGKVKDKCDKKR